MNQGLYLMFRSRKLTFKDVFVRAGVNIEAEPAQLALAKLDELHPGREANAEIFFTRSRLSEGSKEMLGINIDGEFMGRAWLWNDSGIGIGKFFLWEVSIDRVESNWFEDEIWSTCPTLKTKDAKNV